MTKKLKENNHSNFTNENDCHSDKVRRIIEQKPANIVRWGNTLLLAGILVLLLVILISKQ